MSPNGEPGSADLAGQGAAGAEQQIQASTEVEAVAGGPARGTESAEPVAAQSDDTQPSAGDAEPGDAEAAAAADDAEAADRADLEQYPEGVREHFKTLPPARRRELYEHAEKAARTQIEAANKRADDLKREADAREREQQAIRDRHGEFTGAKPIKLNEADGTQFDGPTYDELAKGLQTRRGRQDLLSKYGLTEDQAEAVKAELDTRNEMLAAMAPHFANTAWGQLAGYVKDALAGVPGIDPDAIVAGATGPQEWLPRLISEIDGRHEREKSVLKRNYEDRLNAASLNAEGLRGRVVAAESRPVATGGRTGGGGGRTLIQRLKDEAGSPEEFARRAERGDYAGIDLTAR